MTRPGSGFGIGMRLRYLGSSSLSRCACRGSNPAHAVRGPKHVVKRGKTPVLTEDQARQLLAMHRIDAYEMVRRRTAEAGLNGKLGCHVFQATGITAYLEAGGRRGLRRE